MRYLMISLVLILCACQKDHKQPSAAPSASQDLVKGSGEGCPELSGEYACTLTREEKAAGSKSKRLSLQQYRDSNGLPVLTTHWEGTNPNTIVIDGEVHSVRYKDGDVRYSINCNTSTLSWHSVGPYFNFVSKLTPIDSGRVRIRVTGTEHGQPINDTRLCRRI